MPETVVLAFAAAGTTISYATAALIIQVAVVVTPALYVKPTHRRRAAGSLR